MSAVELHGVAKRFGATPVLIDVELTVPAGSLTAILGTSGSGKTTMMRLIAGFDGIDTGTLMIGGRVVDDGRRTLRPQHRGVGYVPQDGALFPHLTVATGGRVRGRDGALRARRRAARRPAPAGFDVPHALLLRPEQLSVSLEPAAGTVPALVREVYFRGHEALAYLQLEGPGAELLLARVPGTLAVLGGERVWVSACGPGLAIALDDPAYTRDGAPCNPLRGAPKGALSSEREA